MESIHNLNLEPVAPVRPAAAYIGGKRILAKRLVALINATPHACYAEVFVGMGGVFFRRTERPRAEVINDWSEDVSTFFRVLQHHYVAFLDMLRFQITSRANFERLLQQDPSTLTCSDQRGSFTCSGSLSAARCRPAISAPIRTVRPGST